MCSQFRFKKENVLRVSKQMANADYWRRQPLRSAVTKCALFYYKGVTWICLDNMKDPEIFEWQAQSDQTPKISHHKLSLRRKTPLQPTIGCKPASTELRSGNRKKIHSRTRTGASSLVWPTKGHNRWSRLNFRCLHALRCTPQARCTRSHNWHHQIRLHSYADMRFQRMTLFLLVWQWAQTYSAGNVCT